MKKTLCAFSGAALATAAVLSPVAFADASPVAVIAGAPTVQSDLNSSLDWMNKNAKDHDWKLVALYAAVGKTQPAAWAASDLAKLQTSSDYARFILALLAAGQDPHNYNGKNYVAALAKAQLTSGSDAGKFADDITGTGTDVYSGHVWAIIALEDAGQASYNRVEAANWLVSHQNKDGGFGSSSQYSDSDPDSTAAAVDALSLLGFSKDSAPVANALTYLKSQQNPDGGFGSGGTSNADSTAVVIDALESLGIQPDSWTQKSGTPSQALLSFFDASTGGFRWDNTGGQWSGVNEFSTKDGLFGLSALSTQKSVYQRLHVRTFSWLNSYWMDAYHHGGAWMNGEYISWSDLRPMAIAGSFVNELSPDWQAVVKARGMFVTVGGKKVWEKWDTKLALQALTDSFGLNTVHANLL